MQPEKLQLKLYTDRATGISPEAFVVVFHNWIKKKLLPELMIDVANYAHVPKGPGVALIGHGNDYFIDEGEGRLGLLYSRKRGATEPEQRLADAFRRTLHAASLIENDATLATGGAKVRLRTDEVQLRINDRLAAPNDDATFAALKPELDGFCRERGLVLERVVEVRDVGGVMLVVMDLHRAGIDVRFERVKGISEWWDFVGHGFSPVELVAVTLRKCHRHSSL